MTWSSVNIVFYLFRYYYYFFFCCLRHVSCNTFRTYKTMCINNAGSLFYNEIYCRIRSCAISRCLSKIDSESFVVRAPARFGKYKRRKTETAGYYLPFCSSKVQRICVLRVKLSSSIMFAQRHSKCYFIPCNIRNSLTKDTYLLHLRNLEHHTCKVV